MIWLYFFCASVMVLKMNVGCIFSGSHVVIQLVEKYPEYYIVNLDKVNSHSALTYIQECVCVFEILIFEGRGQFISILSSSFSVCHKLALPFMFGPG